MRKNRINRGLKMTETAGCVDSLEAARDLLCDSSSIGYLDYYRALLEVHDGRVPRENDMRSNGLTPFRPYMGVMDCRDRLTPRYRMVGARYAEYFGADPTGRSYLDFVPEQRKSAALEAFDLCMRLPCVMMARILGVSVTGQERLAETVGLPVADDATGAPAFLYMTSIVLAVLGQNQDPAAITKRIGVMGRQFVDIGFGCPDIYQGIPLS